MAEHHRALRRALAIQRHRLSRGLWVLRASLQTVFLMAMLSAAFQILNSFRGVSGSRESILLGVRLDLSEAMLRIPVGLALALPLSVAYLWLTARRDTLLDDAESASLELLNHLIHRTR